MTLYRLPENAPRNWFSERFESTLRQGYSVSMVVVGKRTGISKTGSTVSLAEKLDPKGFTVKDVEDGRYCFYARNYINIVRNTEPYRWIIFDEPARKGSGGSRQEWQTEVNRALASTAQLSRFRLPVSCFIIPHRQLLASSLLGLAQILVVFEDRGYAKLYHIEVSEFDGNIYTPYLGALRISPPSKEVWEAVEDLKAQVWQVDTSKWVSEIDRNTNMQMTPQVMADKILAENALSKVMITDSKGKTKIDDTLIMSYCGVNHTKAGYVRRFLQSKSQLNS